MIKRRFLITIILFSLVTVAYAAGKIDYTGLWKGDCSNWYGVQIKPVDNQLYSVSFCGKGGCFEPGTWMPNTGIDGDPKFNIISPTKLGIRNNDEKGTFFNYIKCTDNPEWKVEQVAQHPPQKQLDCSLKPIVKSNAVLIAWITDVRKTTQFTSNSESVTTVVESFRPVAVLEGTSLNEVEDSSIYKGQPFWQILSPSLKPLKLISVSSFLDHMNYDHCVNYGTIDNATLPRWSLLSSQPLPGVFRKPTQNDRDVFYKLNTTCINQGDYPKGKAPPCVRPELLAVSDINNNQKLEYWATEPYMWDTGLSVWENTGTLNKLLEVCVGCSD